MKATGYRLLYAAGSILDLIPSRSYVKELQHKSDAEKLAGDWVAVGKDLWNAIEKTNGKQSSYQPSRS
ncbi:hypothetical protein [Aeromonas enteropelogenes]|uniref:hypothetical protein n=1 Tax=Aeromonas enteropelogenes TaxID=29489 RepID=UPI003BA39880